MTRTVLRHVHAEVLLANTYMILMLQVERGATEKDIKRAYRQLSKQYHPDKNPDPAAAVYFAESISKAYKALTGQPDRPESCKAGLVT
jgi:translocation protein SEC63